MTYLAKYKRNPKVPLNPGSILMSPGARDTLSWGDIHKALERHVNGDWGQLTRENWEGNNFALVKGFQVSSCYKSRSGKDFRVITSGDRSTTKIMLPWENQ